MIHSAEYNGSIIEYTIEKRKRKTICIKIDQKGCVKVVTPNNVSIQYVSDLVKRKGSWIINTREKVLNRLDEKVVREIKEGSTFLYLGREYPLHLIYDETLKRTIVSLDDVTEKFIIKANTYDEEKIKKELEKWYRARTMEIVLKKINIHAHAFKEKVTEVKVKEQKRRWASCTYKNAILFNWRCCMAPEDVVEYIVVHEMCHFDHESISNTTDNTGKVIDVKPVFEYIDGVSTKNIVAWKYTILLDKNRFQTIDIKVDEKESTITTADIEQSDSGFILVKIIGFYAKLYVNRNNSSINITAKADSIEVIEDEN